MIVVVSGGRNVLPSTRELGQLHEALIDCECIVLRVGCCPTGVDAKVLEFMRELPPHFGGDWVSPRKRRWWAIERWVADWGNQTGRMPGEPRESNGRVYWPSAGMLRTEAMLEGDRSKVLDVEVRGTVSIGGAHRLVHWPGGPGTEHAVRVASRRGISRDAIADLAPR